MQLLQVKVQLEQLQEFYDKLSAEVKTLAPAKDKNEAECDV